MVEQMMKDAFEKRSQDIVEICEKEHNNLYMLFRETLEAINNQTPDQLDNSLGLLEDLFLHSNTRVMKTAYKIGFKDAQAINKEFINFQG
ncbi:hypothetical protein PUW24_11395 [Paenibacillus urinalis]|uniref:Uncharacterized protein n=1 Tax=Paenibacillus urinalis TaxID=521520 RepID=A0ABY7XBW3_9BACL|nr:hypothetical protein [Paenibacillus urinalis]WDH99439.1 hypothetical protein PUW24_11395 [Paenibacillus urinalis]WDI03073.1 hypothetical protein PUW25_03540 [Paenibacillus urinalis]